MIKHCCHTIDIACIFNLPKAKPVLWPDMMATNDHGIYEHILDDDIFFEVVGMLEYDPEFPTHKANYREFLHINTRFHQPIPIQDEAIRRKVYHAHCLQIDIINHVQEDPIFLYEIVRLYASEEVLSGPKKEPEDESMTTDGKGKGKGQGHPQRDGSTPGETSNNPGSQQLVVAFPDEGDSSLVCRSSSHTRWAWWNDATTNFVKRLRPAIHLPS
ncbi:DUF625-domain-containing protein [Paxillus ammoniavirescens]|nr:DUF625-domain-containing protein [Paxillus ammoniavirescens]